MHDRAKDEFDRQAGRLLDEVLSQAVLVAVLLAAGWCAGVMLAHL